MRLQPAAPACTLTCHLLPPPPYLPLLQRFPVFDVLAPPLSLACAVLELRAPTCQQLLGARVMEAGRRQRAAACCVRC